MSGIYDDSNRQIVPRWYTFATACKMGDLQPEKIRNSPKIHSPQAFLKKIEDWKRKRTIPHAIDVVGTALIVGDYANPDVRDASDFLLSLHDKVPSLGLQIANLFNGRESADSILEPYTGVDTIHHRIKVARLKYLVRKYSRNAIAWADLAYHYVLLGEKQKAEECIDIAVSIAGNNRFILRSAARCYLHLHKPDKSLFYLRRSDSIKFDPWVISAEVSISEGINRKSRLVKKARLIIEDTNLSPWSVNELTGTLSTLEARHGTIRKSKKLLHQALREPNENTMAQAVWLAPLIRQEINKPGKEVMASFEADARMYYQRREYEQALENTKEWFRFQPFTARPAVQASYIASVCLQDDKEAIKIIEEAKAASLDSFLLQNNHAFSLASLNRLDEAEGVLLNIKKSELDARNKNTLYATEGLINFRRGNTENGRALYKRAVSGFKKINDLRAAAIAAFFGAREEVLLHSNFEKEVMEEAIDLAKKNDVNELLDYAKLLLIKRQTESGSNLKING